MKTCYLLTTHPPFILGIAVLFWAAAHHGLNSYPPLGKLSKMSFVVPSFNTPPHTRCSPPPPLAKASSSVGRALAQHRLAPPWLHP